MWRDRLVPEDLDRYTGQVVTILVTSSFGCVILIVIGSLKCLRYSEETVRVISTTVMGDDLLNSCPV